MPSPAVLSHDAPLTARSGLLDGDGSLGLALGAAALAVIAVGVAIFAADGLVGAVTLDGLTGTVGAHQLHHTHRVELALLTAVLWRQDNADTHTHTHVSRDNEAQQIQC